MTDGIAEIQRLRARLEGMAKELRKAADELAGMREVMGELRQERSRALADVERFVAANTEMGARNVDLADENARLRNGIKAYLSGDYEHPARHRASRGQCSHGTPWHQSCEQCTDAHFGALIDPVKEEK